MINQSIGHPSVIGGKDGRYKPVITIYQDIILIKSFYAADSKSKSEIDTKSIIIYIGQRDISLDISMTGICCITYPVKTTFCTGDKTF